MMKTKVEDPILSLSNPERMKDIESRIQSLADMDGPQSVLLYGRSGTGKTTIAGTFPGPVIFLDIAEKGTSSVSDVVGGKGFRVENWEDFETMYWFLRAGNHPYKTVVVDTVTMLQKFAREYILEQNGKEKNGVMNRSLWGQVAHLLSAWLINYRDLPMHTVFTAQDRSTDEEENANEDQVIQEVGPRLSPSVAASLTAAVKIIGNTYIKEFVKVTSDGKTEKIYSFRLRIGPHALYLTKVRKAKSIILPNSINDPTYDKLMKAISPKAPIPVLEEPHVNNPPTN
jgi:hypothetical protein